MENTLPFFEKEQMQPVIDFLGKGLELIQEENYKTNLKKIVDNFKVAYDAAADNAEKHAYLYALYINNANAMASYLFLNNSLDDKLEQEFRALPTAKDADEMIGAYRKHNEEERNAIIATQKAFEDRQKGLEVFKGIALGDSPEEAKKGVEGYDKKVAEAMGKQS